MNNVSNVTPSPQDFYAKLDEDTLICEDCLIWNPSKKGVAAEVKGSKITLRPYGQGGITIDNIWRQGIAVPYFVQKEVNEGKEDAPDLGWVRPNHPKFTLVFWKGPWKDEWSRRGWKLIKPDKLEEFKAWWFAEIERRRQLIEKYGSVPSDEKKDFSPPHSDLITVESNNPRWKEELDQSLRQEKLLESTLESKRKSVPLPASEEAETQKSKKPKDSPPSQELA